TRVCRGVFAAGTGAPGGRPVPFFFAPPTPAPELVVLGAGTANRAPILLLLAPGVRGVGPPAPPAPPPSLPHSVVGLAGVIAPLVVGWLVERAGSPVEGYEQGFIVLGVLLISGGVVGMLLIDPEADRTRLAKHAVVAPVVQLRPS